MSLSDMYCAKLNNLLEADGYVERFGKAAFPQKKTIIEVLHLEHANAANKAIDIIETNNGFAVEFLGTFTSIDRTQNDEKNVLLLYDYIKHILRDEVVTMMSFDDRGRPRSSGSATLLFDLSGVEFTDKEYDQLKKPGYRFDSWSGGVSEQSRLLLIGCFVTKLPQIRQLYDDYFAEQDRIAREEWQKEHGILWMDVPTKLAILEPLKILLPLFLIFIIACCMLLFVSWKIFLVFFGIIFFSSALSFTLSSYNYLHCKFVIDSNSVNALYRKMHVFENFADITDIKLVMSAFGKKEKIGTIKIKAAGESILAPKCNLNYIRNADEVYRLLKEQIAAAKGKNI